MPRTKIEYNTGSVANYNRFLKENKLTKEQLPFKKFTKNIEICNWMWIEYALKTGNKVVLPFGFGPIAVNKKMLKRFKEYDGKKYVNLRIDWAKTKKIGKRVYHTNEHTDGYNFKWAWFPKQSKIYLPDLYNFKACRYASREITKYVNKPDAFYSQMYLDWQNTK